MIVKKNGNNEQRMFELRNKIRLNERHKMTITVHDDVVRHV